MRYLYIWVSGLKKTKKTIKKFTACFVLWYYTKLADLETLLHSPWLTNEFSDLLLSKVNMSSEQAQFHFKGTELKPKAT